MNQIKQHVVAASLGAIVRLRPGIESPVLRIIPKNIWLGVLEEMGEWIFVISKETVGWVAKSEIRDCDPMAIHLHRDRGEKWTFGS